MSVIEVRDVVKIYRMGDHEIQALGGITFQIESGELVAITGPSGSGKSTLMYILGCLDRPTSGTYLLEGQDVGSLNDDQLAEIRNRKIGFVFQTFNLLPRTTALENVEIPLIYRGIKKTKELGIDALRQVGLDDRMNHSATQLSGGESQRVAIARALVINPLIILADEPTGNLDTQTGNEIMALFKKFHAQGVTVIVVTHESHIAQQCHRTILMRDGQVIET